MSTDKLPDSKERKKIAEDLKGNFFVEAGAGSGKTHSLVDRMAGLVRYGHAKIENIAAVTFTRKAAAELRERFQIKLEEILHTKGASEAERECIAAALSSFERASISTIHSFCARLLRERPVEAGIDPEFDEIEEQDDVRFAEAVWPEYLERQSFENNKISGWMQEHGISSEVLKRIYGKLVGYPDVKVIRQELPRPDFGGAREAVKQFVFAMKKKMPREEPEKGWDKMQAILIRCIKLIHIGYLDQDRSFVELLKLLCKNTPITQNRWPDGEGKTREQETLEFRKNVAAPALRSWMEYLHQPMIDFALGGVRYYDNWRRERNLLNFQDLLMRTAGMLKGNAEIRDYFKRRITHLLVDEFQDTDPIQAEIVMLLTGEDNSVNDWRKAVPKKGSLFLVGDPKQSIYRFRRADIDIFNQVKNIFKNGSGEVLELTSNFRSLEPIRDLVNAAFKGILPEKDTECQAKFAPLLTVRERSKGFDSGVFKVEGVTIPGNIAASAAQREAPIIAAWIQQAISGGLKLERTEAEKNAGKTEAAEPSDFMIITKIKARLPEYAKELEKLGIPYEISGGENFSQSEELYEIYKVLHAVADPKDPVALAAALRGKYFGVSDDELYVFAKGGGKFTYFYQSGDAPKSILNAFARLRDYRDMTARNTPATAAEKIIEKLGAIPLAISREIGASRAGNIIKAIELLREKKSEDTGSFAEMVDCLREMREIAGIEEMSLFPGTTAAVRIMNLHKAKGLEAPVVFLADPMGIASDHEPEFHVKRARNKSVGYFSISKKAKYRSELIAMPEEWERYVEEEEQYELAEAERLDYVAATRAKNLLVISVYREGMKKKAWEAFYPHLDDAPAIQIKKLPQPRKRKQVNITEQGWAKEKMAMERNITGVLKESYRAGSITSLVAVPEAFEGEPEDGMTWGQIVHRAMEACGRGQREKLEPLVRDWLQEEGRPAEESGKLLQQIDAILQGPLWKRVLQAEEKYYEIPFSVKREETIVSGIMDLIFKEKDGWVVVDYKTGDFERHPKQKAVYENQIGLYAELWEQMTGEKVKEKILCKV